MDSVVRQINDLAELAEAPKASFQHWTAVRAFSGFPLLNNGLVLSYKVPTGHSLIITKVESWVSAGNQPLPNPQPPVEPVYMAQNVIGYWQEDGRPKTNTQAHYAALGKGEQMLIFRQERCARFYLVNQTGGSPPNIDWTFRFEGFLTRPEIADRLRSNETIIPDFEELLCV